MQQLRALLGKCTKEFATDIFEEVTGDLIGKIVTRTLIQERKIDEKRKAEEKALQDEIEQQAQLEGKL
tara:strand:+ start:271 stop:474 length:204 start_codon:yes stop_codon:yes gene_type:complete